MLLDLPLETAFTVVHPAIFAVFPAGVFLLSEEILPEQSAFTSALLYCSFFGYFTLLSRNTRDAIALLFVCAVLVVVISDDGLSRQYFRPLVLLLLTGVLLSHYGVAVLFLIIIGSAYIPLKTLELLSGRPDIKNVSAVAIAFYVIAITAWYINATSGRLFYILVSVFSETLGPILNGSFGESVGTNALSESNISPILQAIRIQYIIVLLFVAVGMLLLVRQLLTKIVQTRFDELDPGTARYTVYAGAFGLPLLLAFSPVHIFGIRRFWLSSMILLVPASVLGIRYIVTRIKLDSGSQIRGVLATFVTISLLINSGVLSAAGLDGRTTQPNLVRDEIVRENDPDEMFHLFNRYTASEDVAATEWTFRYRSGNMPVYGSGPKYMFPSQFFVDTFDPRKPPGNYHALNGTVSRGYVYVPTYVTLGGRVVPYLRSPGPGVSSPQDFPRLRSYGVQNESRVYDAGTAKIYAAQNLSSDT